ncbi:probable LRR receptor-like serine/threonine-protein kinase At4g37250 [Cryptomeria japonica]|uniref:probable LRR receptor-like serine/threonine-protein kinase At4g37250 n=1 Tax=Cryptomeria japonica TaxID=3369 RepID=UPI0027DA684D|nr:probable LRR receptor-like serine/threonine-protein kinase At4g37250 [Cryptomeria japonica]
MTGMSHLPNGCPFRPGLGWWCLCLVLNYIFCSVSGVNQEGLVLLAFKYSVTNDPLSALGDWNIDDSTPCGWNGVTCTQIPGSNESRVISVVLPQSQLVGWIPQELGCLENLRHLDLSGNEINGTIPAELFNATDISKLVLANNAISGALPSEVKQLKGLQYLDLSSNALTGIIPQSITELKELKGISLKNNYLSGPVPSGLGSLGALEALDFSSNLLNESIPPDLGYLSSLQYCLNLSGNRLSGNIPLTLGQLPTNASIDLSHNNLTGQIPRVGFFLSQKSGAFVGNPGLCGQPLTKLCFVPSSGSDPPKISSPSAVAAMPVLEKHKTLSKGTIIAIVLGDLAGISLVCAVVMYRYWSTKQKKEAKDEPNCRSVQMDDNGDYSSSSGRVGWLCLRKVEETSEGSSSENGDQQQGNLVSLDGDLDLDLDKLLRASAYILGATGYTILYKAVLEDGMTFAVRRLGEGGLGSFRDFEVEAKAIGRIKHPNIVRLRGYYWGIEEKLLIYDYIPNGSLANAYYGRSSASPFYLPWAARIKIAKGVARGLAYLHEKKHVHANLKPSNILLGFDMEPFIADFGLYRVLDTANVKYSSSAIYLRNFEGALSGSKRSTGSRDSLQTTPEMLGSPSTSRNFVSPYQAPEALKTLKPNQKWDVYSFGVIFLEMLTGKPPSEKDFATWGQSFLDEKQRILRIIDPTLRSEVEGKEEISTSLRIAFNCCSPSPQKRPAMKEVLQFLEKIPSLSSSTISSD